MDKNAGSKKQKPVRSAVSLQLGDVQILETVLIESGETKFCVFDGEDWELRDSIDKKGIKYVPWSGSNNLIEHGVLLLPPEPIDYDSESSLLKEIRSFIHRYVDLSPSFEAIASNYVLLSWVYDAFSELPYLRLKGDYGTGKSRALQTIGAICYKPTFASGASTTSPLFRMMDSIGGTLLLDEADFRFSDEKTDVIKILNNGNTKGFPVLRAEANKKGEYNPIAYNVFSPKIIATRKTFSDVALESRCITEEMGSRPLRSDIPINLPETLFEEAQALRGKLLMYRSRKLARMVIDTSVAIGEPRIRQIFNPLFSVVRDPKTREQLIDHIKHQQGLLDFDRNSRIEARVLRTLQQLQNEGQRIISVGDITDHIRASLFQESEKPITARWIGHILRHSLGLMTHKSNGRYVLARGESRKLSWLYEKYGIEVSNPEGGDPS